MTNDQLLSEVTLRCGDSEFKDFPKQHYERMLHRAKRSIARKYQLIQRKYSFKVTAKTEEAIKNNVSVYIPSFDAETLVLINGREYGKSARNKIRVVEAVEDIEMISDANSNIEDYNLSAEYSYQLFYDHRNLIFNYTPRTLSDDVELYYVSDINIDDYDEESFEPIIHSRYEESLIENTVVEMAKLGIGKFTGEKADKYKNMISMYAKDGKNPSLVPNEQWIVIKPWQVC